MPDPTIADLLARHLNRIISGLGSDNDAQAIARAIAAQAERLDVLEAVVADRAGQPADPSSAVREAFEAGWEARDDASDVLDAESADNSRYNAALDAAIAAYLAR